MYISRRVCLVEGFIALVPVKLKVEITYWKLLTFSWHIGIEKSTSHEALSRSLGPDAETKHMTSASQSIQGTY